MTLPDRRPRQPRTFVELPANMRLLIEEAIESLLLLLDELDGDADFEEELDLEDGFDREHDLGSTNAINQEHAWHGGRWDDHDGTLEFDGETAESADAEPSLGSPLEFHALSQELWARGGTDDREEEVDF